MIQGALEQSNQAMARSLSAKVGNPILNPTALQEMNNYTTRGLLDAYQNRWNSLANAGQLGTGSAANLGMAGINNMGQANKTIGAGLQSVFGSQPDYQQLAVELLRSNPGLGTMLSSRV